MSKVLPAELNDVRSFFSKELRTVMIKRRIWAEEEAIEYLVGLLMQYIESDSFFSKDPKGKYENQVLAQLYAEYLDGDEQVQRVKLRRLGDVCMFVTGFFPESLKRKIVDVDYYFGMGGTAYGMLSLLQLSKASQEVFAELSAKFKELATVLAELSDRAGLQSNTDLLALYERWLVTGDERLRKLLSEQGIQVSEMVSLKTKQ